MAFFSRATPGPPRARRVQAHLRHGGEGAALWRLRARGLHCGGASSGAGQARASRAARAKVKGVAWCGRGLRAALSCEHAQRRAAARFRASGGGGSRQRRAKGVAGVGALAHMRACGGRARGAGGGRGWGGGVQRAAGGRGEGGAYGYRGGSRGIAAGRVRRGAARARVEYPRRGATRAARVPAPPRASVRRAVGLRRGARTRGVHSAYSATWRAGVGPHGTTRRAPHTWKVRDMTGAGERCRDWRPRMFSIFLNRRSARSRSFHRVAYAPAHPLSSRCSVYIPPLPLPYPPAVVISAPTRCNTPALKKHKPPSTSSTHRLYSDTMSFCPDVDQFPVHDPSSPRWEVRCRRSPKGDSHYYVDRWTGKQISSLTEIQAEARSPPPSRPAPPPFSPPPLIGITQPVTASSPFSLRRTRTSSF